MAGRVWTAEEDAAVRAGYGTVPTPELARSVGRSEGAVRLRGWLLGRAGIRRLTRDPELVSAVLALHAEGLTATTIGARIPCCRHTVTKVLRAAGKDPGDKTCAEYRANARARLLARMESGAKNPGRVRWHDRAASTRYGLPPMGPVKLAIVLFLANGPKTRRQIAAHLGVRWLRSRSALKSHGSNSHTGDLIQMGLVSSVRLYTGGKSQWHALYSLTPMCLELLSRPRGKAGA